MNNDLATIDATEEGLSPFLFSLDERTVANCKLCKSKNRKEVEGWYDVQKRKNYTEIKRRIEEEFQTDISVPAIRNHLLRHYQATENNISLNEYSRGLREWLHKQSNKGLAIKSRIAVLDREMMSLAEKGDDLVLEDRQKNAEIIKKLSESILLHEKQLKEYQTEVEPVKMVFNQLAIVINEEIEQGGSVQIKKVLTNVLSKLQNSVGDIVIQ